MNKGAKIAVGIGIGCAVICLVGGIIALIAGGAFFKWLMEQPENVVINVDAPATAAMDEEFTIEIQIENAAQESQTLKCIDFQQTYLEGILISDSAPRFTESTKIPIVEYISYAFEENIPPGETLVVRFSAVAFLAGDYSGDVDICINKESVCSTVNVRTIVR